MKKHWKKILLSIFGIYLVYGIITLVPAYLENKEWEQREQTAIESINIMDDPNLSQYEKNKKLRDLHGIPDDGVVVKGNLRYELQDNSYAANSNNSFDKSSKAYKELYLKVKDIAYKHDFHIYTDNPEKGLHSYRYDGDRYFLDYYEDYYEDYSGDFLVLKFSIDSFSMGEEFSSKDYEVLQDIIDVLDISDFSIDISNVPTPGLQRSTIDFDNCWFLDYEYDVYSPEDDTYTKDMILEFKKQL